MNEQESRYSAEIYQALAEFAEVRDGIEPTDKVSLIDERLAIRPKKDSEFDEYVSGKTSCGRKPARRSATRTTKPNLAHENESSVMNGSDK